MNWRNNMPSLFERLASGYYNVTPPETWSDERKPHFSDDLYTRQDLGRDVSNETQDPRFWSNIKGMFTGKSRENRIAAHQDLDSTKFRTAYGDEVMPEIREYYKSQNRPIPTNIPKEWLGDETSQKVWFSADEGYRANVNRKQSSLFDLLNKKEYGTLDIPFGVSQNMKP